MSPSAITSGAGLFKLAQHKPSSYIQRISNNNLQPTILAHALLKVSDLVGDFFDPLFGRPRSNNRHGILSSLCRLLLAFALGDQHFRLDMRPDAALGDCDALEQLSELVIASDC